MLKRLVKYLWDLRNESFRLERTDINGKRDDTRGGKYFSRVLIVALSVVIFFFLDTGFPPSFVSFVSSVLAILVGLYITALVFSFDKFYKPTGAKRLNSKDILLDTQDYNFTKIFFYLTGYTIVLCIFALLLLSASALFEDETRYNINSSQFCREIMCFFNASSIGSFFWNSFLIFQRISVIVLLSQIILNSLYIVSSMVQFMSIKLDRDSKQ